MIQLFIPYLKLDEYISEVKHENSFLIDMLISSSMERIKTSFSYQLYLALCRHCRKSIGKR